MKPPERERDHRTIPIRVDFGICFVTVMVAIEIIDGIDLRESILKTA